MVSVADDSEQFVFVRATEGESVNASRGNKEDEVVQGIDDMGQVYYYDTVTGDSAWTKEGFVVSRQDDQGNEYWLDRCTGHSAWRRDDLLVETRTDVNGNTYYEHAVTGKTGWSHGDVIDLPPTIERVKTDDGEEYYYNAKTGTTAWTIEDALKCHRRQATLFYMRAITLCLIALITLALLPDHDEPVCVHQPHLIRLPKRIVKRALGHFLRLLQRRLDTT